MSHAIRTPLSGILGMSELLLEQTLDSDTREVVKTVHESAQALLSIVNDILDLSKLGDELIHLDCKPFDPSVLVNDCVTLVQPGADNKLLKLTITIANNIPERVIGDQSRIRQILLNLLGNAIKFTAQGTIAVRLSLEHDDDTEATLQFSVVDTGPGIDKNDAPLLFTPFSRIERSTRGIKGSGLGLAISKRFVELMHGAIGFESEKELGSRFWFTLPLKKVASSAEASGGIRSKTQIARETESLMHRRVLVVEDNPVLSALTLRQLSKFNMIAQAVTNGGDAVRLAGDNDYDIILLDVNLPDISGYEVTQRIRQMESSRQGHRNIIIAMTAGAMSGDREKALEAGMDDYLAKPVHTAQLKDTLVCWLQQTKLTEAENRRL